MYLSLVTWKIMRYLFMLLLVFALQPLTAQKPPDILPALTPDKYIDVKQLLGIWETTDSMKYRIEFTYNYFDLVMKSGDSRPYYFSKDSLDRVYSSGYYPNWPPFNCDLRLTGPGKLEVTYSQLGVPATTIKFVKLK